MKWSQEISSVPAPKVSLVLSHFGLWECRYAAWKAQKRNAPWHHQRMPRNRRPTGDQPYRAWAWPHRRIQKLSTHPNCFLSHGFSLKQLVRLILNGLTRKVVVVSDLLRLWTTLALTALRWSQRSCNSVVLDTCSFQHLLYPAMQAVLSLRSIQIPMRTSD